MPQQFGSATLYAQSQTPEGSVPGANPAKPAFLVGSACLVNAAFFDTTGAPLIPAALAYRIDDVCSGEQILGWTTLAPAPSLQVIVTAAQNAMVSNSQSHEDHQVTFKVTDGLGNIAEPYTKFSLVVLTSCPQ